MKVVESPAGLRQIYNLFKLEKLKFVAYEEPKRKTKIKTFHCMFNPASYKLSYKTCWNKKQGINSSAAELVYSKSDPQELELTILLDDTGAHEPARDQFWSAAHQAGFTIEYLRTVEYENWPWRHKKVLRQQPVWVRLEDFLNVAYKYDGKIHQPRYLKAIWGNLNFDCRLKSADVTVTAFNRDGTPLRAEVDIVLLLDKDNRKRLKEENKSSPDLTHSRIVKSGDTLPLLTKEIYGSPRHYLDVARFNELDDFRRLTPGQTLYFPPLANLISAN